MVLNKIRKYNGNFCNNGTTIAVDTYWCIVSQHSPSFTAFASTFVLEKMLMKFMMGYAVAACGLCNLDCSKQIAR